MSELQHHGILGQKWGVRRWQNEDGTYNAAGKARYFNSDGSLNRAGQKYEERLKKKDLRYVAKHEDKIVNSVKKTVKKELRQVDKELNAKYRKQLRSGKVGYQYMFERNSRMAELMNKSPTQLRSPSGKCIKFVAKRREMGVYIALTSGNVDMKQFRQGVFADGKIGYRNQKANMQRYDKELKHHGILG